MRLFFYKIIQSFTKYFKIFCNIFIKKQKYKQEENKWMQKKTKRNNANSAGSNNCSTINIGRNNNKSSVWVKWSDTKSPRQ